MKIGIVGGGLTGYLLGCLLHRKGYTLTIITLSDKKGYGSAAYAAAGMLTPIVELENSDGIIYTLGMQSIGLWKKLLPTFSKKVFFQFNGSIIAAHRNDHPELSKFINRVKSKLPNDNPQLLTSQFLQELEPELQLKKGLYLPMDGQIASRSLLSAIADELNTKNITWHIKTKVKKVEPRCIHTEKNTYHFDHVFDCRGYTAKDIFPNIRGVRGELIYVHAPDVKLTRPIRLLHPRYQTYIVPLPNSIYIIGASEIEAEDNSPISVRTCLELLTAAYSIHPGFAEARITETITALRPALPTNLPKIKCEPGLIAINGLYRHGFLIAPAIINDAITLLEQGKTKMHYPELLVGELT